LPAIGTLMPFAPLGGEGGRRPDEWGARAALNAITAPDTTRRARPCLHPTPFRALPGSESAKPPPHPAWRPPSPLGQLAVRHILGHVPQMTPVARIDRFDRSEPSRSRDSMQPLPSAIGSGGRCVRSRKLCGRSVCTPRRDLTFLAGIRRSLPDPTLPPGLSRSERQLRSYQHAPRAPPLFLLARRRRASKKRGGGGMISLW